MSYGLEFCELMVNRFVCNLQYKESVFMALNPLLSFYFRSLKNIGIFFQSISNTTDKYRYDRNINILGFILTFLKKKRIQRDGKMNFSKFPANILLKEMPSLESRKN